MKEKKGRRKERERKKMTCTEEKEEGENELEEKKEKYMKEKWMEEVYWGSPRSVMVNEPDCNIVVREFELQSRFYVHSRSSTLGKGMYLYSHSSYRLNSTTAILPQE